MPAEYTAPSLSSVPSFDYDFSVVELLRFAPILLLKNKNARATIIPSPTPPTRLPAISGALLDPDPVPGTRVEEGSDVTVLVTKIVVSPLLSARAVGGDVAEAPTPLSTV